MNAMALEEGTLSDDFRQLKTREEHEVKQSIAINRKNVLGRGGYGTVFKGIWNGKTVAVKRIEIKNTEDSDREVKAMQKLDHPNVIKLLHIGSDNDFKYYVLELCQLSLHQLFTGDEDQKKYRKKMPSQKQVFLQLATGLEYIHKERLIHRDIKPENVLIHVDSTGEKVTMKWADFGLSKQVNERGTYSMSRVKGTDNWVAPEILKKIVELKNVSVKRNETHSKIGVMPQRGTVKSDVFTEGLVFGYYFLGGIHPYGPHHNIMRNISADKPINLNKITKRQPIHDIVMEMLKKNPDERISSSDVVRRIIKIADKTEKKTYANFLIDQPFNNNDQRRQDLKIILMNCLRHRLPIALKLKIDTEVMNTSNQITNFRVVSLYDTLLQLVDQFDATGIAEIFRLLLQRRSAIPLFIPKSKRHFLSLIRHVTLPRINNICLGDDKSLKRVAVISCRRREKSQTCDFLKNIFHINSIHSLDLAKGNISSETMLAEIGCGCIVTEGSQPKNVLVVHVVGDFRPLWSFLRRFADCFLIEDSTNQSESFFSSFMTKAKQREIDSKDAKIGVKTNEPMACLWKPSFDESSLKKKEINGFVHLYIEDQLTDKTRNKMKSWIFQCIEETSSVPNFTNNRLTLCEIPILEENGYISLDCVSPTKYQSRIGRLVKNLENVKKTEFLLQKNFLQEAKHQENKMEHRLNEERLREEDDKIKVFRAARRTLSRQVETNPLLQLFLSFLENVDPCSRILSIRMLEKELTKRGQQDLGPLLQNVAKTHALYFEILHKSNDEELLESLRENLKNARANVIESTLNMEHLWRELSHLYTDTEPGKRSTIIKKIPQLAAQHLIDGFSLELLDGDSNMLRLDWVNEVLRQLDQLINGKRIFVLSVMGVQSSGKSTLLNAMFGIRMRTSVGQCTRGVNMQLLAVEGRPEYDYILLLDTEGTRSPEFHGVPGSEKRDNQMATLSILLSDASIVVIPGENDAAVKEILPIVLMAYQGSRLAEDNGGRLSSRMFFVYNRINTKEKKKLDTIIQTLGTSLHEAFSQVQKSNGDATNLKTESPFANFKLIKSDSSKSDVCILGNVKKQTKPPGDVPDEEYGKELIQFREHIHRRVTNIEGGAKWKSRSISEFSSYIKNVWNCICSANFIFTFTTILEHITFDKLDLEYKKIERKLAEAYENSFGNVKKEMLTLVANKNSSVPLDQFEKKLKNQLHSIIEELNKDVDYVVNNKGREKWKQQFEKTWENYKNEKAFNWRQNMKNTYDRIFNYENRVEEYKKKMRQEINEFFKSPANSNISNYKEEDKNNKFEEMFAKLLNEAKKEFPPKIVLPYIKKEYQESTAIKNRQIHINYDPTAEKKEDKNPHVSKFDKLIVYPIKMIFNSYGNETEKKQNAFNLCAESVKNNVKSIAAGKPCYDDSIISEFIRGVDSKINEYHIEENSAIQELHGYGMELIVNLMENIQKEWEKDNSVPSKLKSSKEILRNHFVRVSEGVAKTKLFASAMADNLEKCIISEFEMQMVQKTFKKIRNERWLYDARFMQKHMDLYLIDLLEDHKLDETLDNIRCPKELYTHVLHQLIAKKVVNVNDEWESFIQHLRNAIQKAVAVEVEKGRAQTFVDHLQKEFLEGYLQSETLGLAFQIDCSGEYEDCDSEEMKQFQEACSTKLNDVLNRQETIFLNHNQENYLKQLSPKVVQYMLKLNDKAALPRCDTCCPMCKSLCIEPANHDTKEKPHDAVHQPDGIAGISLRDSKKLTSTSCSHAFEQDEGFYLVRDPTVLHKYRDFATVFPGWKDPRINEELSLREYILATYNEEIAKKYNKKPADDIPASYFRDLSSIKEQLLEETANLMTNLQVHFFAED